MSKDEIYYGFRIRGTGGYMNNKGSTLVLLVIVIALILVLGTGVLNVVMKQYEIKKFNTASKQAFYLSETGLNESYVRSCALIDESIINALERAGEYLAENPLKIEEAENLFVINYKMSMETNIKDRVETFANPSVEVRIPASLVFLDNEMTVFLRSSYIYNNVEKLTWVELIIRVPEYSDCLDGVYEVKDYIRFANWNS